MMGISQGGIVATVILGISPPASRLERSRRQPQDHSNWIARTGLVGSVSPLSAEYCAHPRKSTSSRWPRPQYTAGTSLLPFKEARSSYFPLLDRFGSLTFFR